MYNARKPSDAELPSSTQLIKSTLIALGIAVVLLITVVLPSEYAIDPTGAGRLLGLTEMGEIKEQLAEEAAADRLKDQVTAQEAVAIEVENSQLKPAAVIEAEPEKPVITWKDEINLILKPGQGAEVKLTMQKGATAQFSWVAEGGPVNFDTHGDGSGQSISYEKGRSIPSDDGELTAAFTGNHGWFFRNRKKNNVTVVLKTRGDYGVMKRVL